MTRHVQDNISISVSVETYLVGTPQQAGVPQNHPELGDVEQDPQGLGRPHPVAGRAILIEDRPQAGVLVVVHR